MFRCYLSKRWNELIQPDQPLNLSSIEAFIDQTVVTISEAVVRENALWGMVGNHKQQIEKIKSFLSSRIAWMTTNLGLYSVCSDVSVPPLVITKIMYHPATSAEFPEEDDLEFIEILNNGDQTINLTGIYFSGTGLAFQFPVNSTLNPRLPLILASNPSVFQDKYGFAPFGQFTRHLSNKSQNLMLADGFGNIIDNVLYLDTIPWPDADGNGNYLSLTDPDLDNNLAENWLSLNEISMSRKIIPAGIEFQLYPNPVSDVLRIQAESEIELLCVSDIQGRLLVSLYINHKTYELDMRRFNSGTYIIRIITAEKTYTGKIIKD
jgi:hypothetical protein